jgi:hypothetical protein
MVSRNTAAALCIAVFLSFTLLTLLHPVSASGAAPSIVAQEHAATAQEFVEHTLRTWQERLNLKDWNIHVELVRANALEPKTLGNVHWDTNTKQATIGVLSSYDYTLPFPDMLNDMEVTVVHELVHLQLSSLPRTEATRGQEEYAVCQITRALLKLAKH